MMRSIIFVALVSVAGIANAAGFSYGSGSTASQSQAGSSSYGVAIGNGYALEATQTGAVNSSGVHIDATGGAAHGVDLDTYSVGQTWSFNQSAVGGSAFGFTTGSAYQGGYGAASGYAVDWAF